MEKQIVIHNSKSELCNLNFEKTTWNVKLISHNLEKMRKAPAVQQFIVNRLSPDLLCCYRWLEGIQSWKTCDFAILVLN